ncbi:MAG: TIGR03016 family PEP-CTERM system-associated outer membrane protein [Halioglobus sp.]|nr:TIGR03016 family PEP-CTERM system-associated outer membrane protein [Halioglobus sp.]
MEIAYCRAFLKVSLLMSWAFVLSSNALAVNWEASLLFSPSLIYTDNVCLTKANKKNDFTAVALVTPSGTASVETARTSLNVTASVIFNTLTNGDLRDDGCTGDALDDRQQYFPRIFATLRTTLIDNWVKFDASLRADQNRINSSRGNSNDGLDRNGNTNTFYRYTLSPYMERRLRNDLSTRVRYTYSEVVNSANDVSDSDRHAVNGSLRGRVGPDISWNFRGQASKTGYKDDVFNRNTGEFVPREDTKLRNLSLTVANQLHRTLQVNGTYGWEWNDFQTTSNSDTGGSAWDVGLVWTPSERTAVSVGFGDRFFGTTPRINFRHSYKNHEILGSYRKTITFERDLSTFGLDSFSDGFGGGDGGFDDPLFNGPDIRFDDNGVPIDGIGTNTSVSSNGPIIDERFTLRYAYVGRPGQVTFFGSYSEQTREEDGAKADFGDWVLTVTPDLSRKFVLSGAVGYEDVRPSGFARFDNDPFDPTSFSKAENWFFRLVLVRILNSRMNTTFEYRFTDRRSDDETNEYQENLLRATLNISL